MLLCSILAMFTAVYKLLSVPFLPPRCLNESKKVHKGSMEVENVSKFLKGIKVWHKVRKNCICTKRTCIKIPEITGGVAYLAGAITGDGSIGTCKRKADGHYYSVRLWGRKEKLTHVPALLNNLFHYRAKIFRDGRKRNCYYINANIAGIYAYFVLLELEKKLEAKPVEALKALAQKSP